VLRAPRIINEVSRPNKRMHATRISAAFILNLRGGRVMRGVRQLLCKKGGT
jgi:hypothetical protein